MDFHEFWDQVCGETEDIVAMYVHARQLSRTLSSSEPIDLHHGVRVQFAPIGQSTSYSTMVAAVVTSTCVKNFLGLGQWEFPKVVYPKLRILVESIRVHPTRWNLDQERSLNTPKESFTNTILPCFCDNCFESKICCLELQKLLINFLVLKLRMFRKILWLVDNFSHRKVC